jgi:hypothetical protein
MQKCIVTLVDNKNPHELNNLVESLNTFFVVNNKDVDFLIFYEDGFDKNAVKKLNISGKTIYHKVDFSTDHLSDKEKLEIPTTFYNFNIGYRMMCRFFSGEIFKILKKYNYEYILRLDTDSSFYEIVNRNIFDEFINNNASYGYINITNDRMEVRSQLLHHITNYIVKNKITTNISLFDTIIHNYNLVYYTNFEMIKVSEFTNDKHLNFYQHLDSINGFLKFRWGDHAVRFFYVNLFINKEHIHYFNDVAYKHQFYLKNRPFSLNEYII